MNDSTQGFPPRRLLLATDLCARCDRPLDRARQLALEWRAGLDVLMVREAPGTPEEVSSWLAGERTVHPFEVAARRELAIEFADTGIAPALQVAQGDVPDNILRAAAGLADALIIIGASRDETFQQLILGSTAGRLAQELAQPLLVVRQRTRGSYARIVVANDFKDAARRALATALRLFPSRRICLLHALDDSVNAPPGEMSAALQLGQAQSQLFLDRCQLPAAVRERIDIVIRHGAVADAITAYAGEQQVELAVLGVHRYSAVARVFMGTRSDDLLQRLPCDTLLVRAPDDASHA